MLRRTAAAIAAALVVFGAMSASAQTRGADPASATAGAVANEERPLTHDELLRVRGFHERSALDKLILIADATILRDRAFRAPQCPDTRKVCPFGVLPRSQEGLDDPIVLAGRQDAEGWPDDDSPIEGRLAFSLGRHLRMLGPVSTPTGTHAVPNVPEAMAIADALPVGSLIVVEGWLTADRIEPTNELDPSAPEGYGVAVRTEDLGAFAPPPAGSASYLLRRIADAGPGSEPRRSWEVVGRVDPISDELSIGDRVAEKPGGLRWQPVLEPLSPADTQRVQMTAWAGGFAAILVGLDGVLTATASPDGRAWSKELLPTTIRRVAALLPLADRLALVANYRRWPVPRFEVWTSEDGLRWRRVGPFRFRPMARFGDRRHFVGGFTSIGGRIVVTETYESGPCCGRGGAFALLAAQPDALDRAPEDARFALVSRDGLHFTRHRVRRSADPPDGAAEGPARTVPQDAAFETWYEEDGMVMLGTSTDGIVWRAVGPLPGDLDPSSPFEIVRTSDGYVLAGEPFEGGASPGNHLTIWHGTSDLAWSRAFDADHHTPWHAIDIGATVVLVGTRIDPAASDLDDPPRLPWVLASTDGGRTWDASLAWRGDVPLCLGPLAAGDEVVLMGVGCPPAGVSALQGVEAEAIRGAAPH